MEPEETLVDYNDEAKKMEEWIKEGHGDGQGPDDSRA